MHQVMIGVTEALKILASNSKMNDSSFRRTNRNNKGLQPREFKGGIDVNIIPWLRDVEQYGADEGWDEATRLRFIKRQVSEQIARSIEGLGEPDREDYNKVIEFLKSSFSAKGAAAYAKVQFNNRIQKADESFTMYAGELRRLRSTAFPSESRELAESNIKDRMHYGGHTKSRHLREIGHDVRGHEEGLPFTVAGRIPAVL